MRSKFNSLDVIRTISTRYYGEPLSLTSSYVKLLARLAACGQRIGSEKSNFSQAISEAFSCDVLFGKIDRICLAERVSGGNQLVVLDSYLRADRGRNDVAAGYTCFVSPQSTLFSLTEGTFRTYSNKDCLVESFLKEGRPLQRSTAKIFNMNLESGIALPLCRGGKPEGFLFLNSCEPALFDDLQPEDLLVLSLLTSITGLAFSMLKHQGIVAPDSWAVDLPSIVDAELLWKLLELEDILPGKMGSAKQFTQKLLVNPATLGVVIAAAKCALRATTPREQFQVLLDFEPEGSRVCIRARFSSTERAETFSTLLGKSLLGPMSGSENVGAEVTVWFHADANHYDSPGLEYSV